MKHLDGEFLAFVPLHHAGLDVLGTKVAHHLRNHGLVFGLVRRRYGFHKKSKKEMGGISFRMYVVVPRLAKLFA